MGKYYDFLKNKLNFEETDTTMIKVINIQAAILANIIAESYAKYTKQCNVPEDQRWLISMKNELTIKAH